MEKDWRKLDYHAIILEAVKKTRIVYDFNTGFFSPRFKSLNNLTTGNSKMIIKRLSIIGDILYDLAIIIKIAFKKFIKGLFPKKDIIYGSKKDSSLVGTITLVPKKTFINPFITFTVNFGFAVGMVVGVSLGRLLPTKKVILKFLLTSEPQDEEETESYIWKFIKLRKPISQKKSKEGL